MTAFWFLYIIVFIVSLFYRSSLGAWLEDESNRLKTEDKHARDPVEFVVNLDLPAEERWTEVGEKYKDQAFLIINYLRTNLPRGWLKPLEKLCSNLLPFFQDYGDEMAGYARALNITEGDIVMVNLVYQLERLGLSCSSWNTTGPTDERLCERGEDDDGNTDTKDSSTMRMVLPWANLIEEDSPGQCTSFVAYNGDADKIYHGRNLDWNLQDTLKQFIINVQFTRGGENLYKATTVVGFVGILHAVKPGKFGYSMDARRKGGEIPFNLLEALFKDGTRTPEQHARYCFENYDDFDSVIEGMGNHDIVNPVYYIVSGVSYPQGAVLARDRKGVVHDYRMNDIIKSPGGNVQQNFWVGITNYDLEWPPLPADDRATPMTDNLNALEGKDFNDQDIWKILTTWPTMNMHTDIGAVIDVQTGSYDVKVWFDHRVP